MDKPPAADAHALDRIGDILDGMQIESVLNILTNLLISAALDYGVEDQLLETIAHGITATRTLKAQLDRKPEEEPHGAD